MDAEITVQMHRPNRILFLSIFSGVVVGLLICYLICIGFGSVGFRFCFGQCMYVCQVSLNTIKKQPKVVIFLSSVESDTFLHDDWRSTVILLHT